MCRSPTVVFRQPMKIRGKTAEKAKDFKAQNREKLLQKTKSWKNHKSMNDRARERHHP